MTTTWKELTNKTVVVAALGYFIDVYDLVLFGVVRVASLKGIGVAEADLLSVGAWLLNLQMAGMLSGGFAWGLLGDKLGRMRALYGSILLYSLANIANAFVTDTTSYGVLRFLAGFGLAGELGAAVTLVSEVLPARIRGLGSAVIGMFGFLGAVCSATVSGLVSWQTSYLIGGALGLLLLMARIQVTESKLFEKAGGQRTRILALLTSPERFWRFQKCFWVGVPIWFISGVLLYFAPEFGRELGLTAPVAAGQAILFNYLGAVPGDIVGGLLCQKYRSRRKVLLGYIGLLALLLPLFFFALPGASPAAFYLVCFLLGLGQGYWALFIGMSAEQFGTNVRATVATSIPNLVRGAVIPMTTLFIALKPSLGVLNGSLLIGAAVIALAFVSLASLPETFSRELDFVET